MNLPEMSVIDTHLPSNTKIRGYTPEQMLAQTIRMRGD